MSETVGNLFDFVNNVVEVATAVEIIKKFFDNVKAVNGF